MLFNRLAMHFGAIALIGIPGIVRKQFMQPFHVFIPIRLSQDAGGGNRGIQPISLYDAFMWRSAVFHKTISIDQQQLRPLPKLIERQVHGFERSFQDIDPVDLVMIDGGNPIAERMVFDISPKLIPVFFSNLF